MGIQKVLTRILPGEQQGMRAHLAWLARRFGRSDLAPFSPHDVEALSRTLERVEAPAGTRILSAGEAADTCYIIVSGEVALLLPGEDGRRLLAIQRSGGVVGDVPLLCEMPSPYLALARSDTDLLALHHDALLELLHTHPAVALRWLTSTVRRLEHANRRLVALTVGSLRDRVVALLADEVAGEAGAGARVGLTQSELAALLGASRQGVNRVLGELVEEGLIRTGYGSVEVTEPGRLLELAGQRGRLGDRC